MTGPDAPPLAWLDAHLTALGRARTGSPDPVHSQPWSTVLRVPTTAGNVWMKSVSDDLRHEAAVHSLLAACAPDRVPPLLAADLERGWMLIDDAGRRLREVIAEEGSLDRWHDVLGATARLQLGATSHVPELLATGMPHRPLTRLADDYATFVAGHDIESRFRAATPLVATLSDRLASYGIAETIQHDDLHDGQVFLGLPETGSHLLLDWGDACVSHPFFTLAITLFGVIAWGVDDTEDSEDTTPYRDTYLAPFARAYGVHVADLAEAAGLGARLGWACRAINGHVEDDPDSTRTRLEMFLDGRPG